MNGTEIRYFGWVPRGRKQVELLVTRRNGKQVSAIETGNVYRSLREAERITGEKNARLAVEQGLTSRALAERL